ncbi:rod shape-determining protein MreD [Erythrobacter sp. SDW2]|uniref:rod shape-determining protein MreD n=1 Tax=Erythrobacter sp. SDW2 TaxID=2907154 RepID=UPI001F36B080|nr:rod shape-determining protein MreD [Erythrobacter sp. SDW2]UIP05839.1 rod shape-determining protein MreD [Erythrobacter sp. SDW2]
MMPPAGLDRIQHAAARRDQYGSRINRDHSPVLLVLVPWGTIMLAAVVPFFFLTSAIPLVPPLALLFLLAWRLVRPGVLPVWAGLPLGLWTDLYSGQPFGCSVLLFSLSLLTIEVLETRFPWRDFLQDWATAMLAILAYIGLGVVFSGADVTPLTIIAVAPQALLSVLAYPIVARMVAALDRIRLLRIRVVR